VFSSDICSFDSFTIQPVRIKNFHLSSSREQETVLDAIHSLGILYADQGKLGEAEQMYERVSVSSALLALY
jgi:hypothetical protein